MLKFNVDSQIKNNMRDDSQLRVTGVVQVYDKKDWFFPPHSHKELVDLVLITNGEGTLHFNHGVYKTQKGDKLVFDQDVLHGEYTNPDNPLETIGISLKGVQVAQQPPNHVLPDKALPIVKTNESFLTLFHLFHLIRNECLEQKNGFEIICQDAAKAVLSIIQVLVERNEPKTTCESVTMEFPVILDVVEYLNINYNKNISLDDLAKVFHFSSYYIARKFKEETGFTINQYLTNRRMGEAEKLLIFTDMTMTEIAAEVGYENLHHFYATFKKQIGIAPGQLKEMYNRK